MKALRDLAARRYRENDLRAIRLAAWRRFLSAFLFGVAITTLGVLTISTAARRAAQPVTVPIQEGLHHGE
jgi:hypothetical protein